MVESIHRSLIRNCLYNWLGYGKLDAETWFVGMEEGGAEVWRKPEKPLSLEESLAKRTSFDLAMDFQKVWRTMYGYDDIGDGFPYLIASRNNVWRYVAAFYLYQNGTISSQSTKKEVEDKIDEFLRKDFGTKKADLFLCEFMPLPRRNRKDWPELYQNVWPSAKAYYEEVMPKRFRLIVNEILKRPKIKQIVSFSSDFTEYLLNAPDENGKLMFGDYTIKERWMAEDKKHYAIYSVRLTRGRSILVLKSPFFGYMGYNIEWYEKKGLPYAAEIMTNYN